jgi:hypothetical protein
VGEGGVQVITWIEWVSPGLYLRYSSKARPPWTVTVAVECQDAHLAKVYTEQDPCRSRGILSFDSSKSMNWSSLPPSRSLNGTFHSFRKDNTRRHTCLILIQTTLLKIRLFLFIHSAHRSVEKTRLKCKNVLLQSHLDAMDSKSSAVVLKNLKHIIPQQSRHYAVKQ